MGTRGFTSLLWFFHEVRPQGREALGYGLVFGPLAQSVEQRTFNPWVVGSIPTGPTCQKAKSECLDKKKTKVPRSSISETFCQTPSKSDERNLNQIERNNGEHKRTN